MADKKISSPSIWTPGDLFGQMIYMTPEELEMLAPLIMGYRVVEYDPETDRYGSFFGTKNGYYGGLGFRRGEPTYVYYTFDKNGNPTTLIPDDIKEEIASRGGTYNDLEKYGWIKLEHPGDLPSYGGEKDIKSLIRDNYLALDNEQRRAIDTGNAGEELLLELIDNGGVYWHPLTGNKRGLYISPDAIDQLMASSAGHFAYSFWGLPWYLTSVLGENDLRALVPLAYLSRSKDLTKALAGLRPRDKGLSDFLDGSSGNFFASIMPGLIAADYVRGRKAAYKDKYGYPNDVLKYIDNIGLNDAAAIGGNFGGGYFTEFSNYDGRPSFLSRVASDALGALMDEGVIKDRGTKEKLIDMIAKNNVSYVPSRKGWDLPGGMFNPDAIKEVYGLLRDFDDRYGENDVVKRLADLSDETKHRMQDLFMRELLLRRIGGTFRASSSRRGNRNPVLVQAWAPYSAIIGTDQLDRHSPQTDGGSELRGTKIIMSDPVATRAEFHDDVDNFHDLLLMGASPEEAWHDALPPARYGEPENLGSDKRLKNVMWKGLKDDAERKLSDLRLKSVLMKESGIWR